MPGTNKQVAKIIEKFSGKKNNEDFAVISNPEFLREGSAVEDYFNPALTVVGSDNSRATEKLRDIYDGIEAPFIETDINVAEMIKYINNTFHALKIAFANEVGNICKSIGVDPFHVMDLFKMDDRLNISTAYLNPGMAYGGSCLPKDLKGLVTIAHDNYLTTPIIDSIENSNEIQKTRVLELVKKYDKKNIGLLGLSFKKGTDDLRFSPSVELAESLIGKGYNLKIFDKNVQLSKLMGVNKNFINKHLPHISNILENNLGKVIENVDLMIVAHKPDSDELKTLQKFNGPIIELVKLPRDTFSGKSVEGLSW